MDERYGRNTTMERKLSISVQDFEKLRTENYIYADKTEFVWKLARQNGQYFLSRPRRFGKSLLLSTMKAYWEGRRELFSGLIEDRQYAKPYQADPRKIFMIGAAFDSGERMLTDWEIRERIGG